jgi:hypothetical protein
MPGRFHQQHSDLHAWWLRARKDVEGTARNCDFSHNMHEIVRELAKLPVRLASAG